MLYMGGAARMCSPFVRGDGDDVIKDFEDNVDTIELSGFFLFFDPFTALNFATDTGGDVLFDFGFDRHVAD